MLARSQTVTASLTCTVIRDARIASLKRIYYSSPLPRLRLRQFASSAPALAKDGAGDALAGSVAHHSAYVFLHAHAPPSAPAFPARSKSPLWRALTLKARAWGAIVNFSWAPEQLVHPAYTGLGEEGAGRAWGLGLGWGRGKGAGEGQGEEAYVASVFSTTQRARLHVPEVSLANLDAVDAALRALCAPDSPSSPRSSSNRPGDEELVQQVDDKRLLLYVCTHGSRDCRCGQAGGDVARALRAQVARRGLADAVFVGDAAHVGGHKFAANVLVYPYGDWLGKVQEADVPQILDELLARHAQHRDTDWRGEPLPPPCPPFWRGRMGLDKDAQLALAPAPTSTSRIA